MGISSGRFDPDDNANPCGYIARSFFNDTFDLKDFDIDEDDIAWPDDIENVYERVGSNWETKQWLDVENEHLMVWYRTGALSTFRKLWGKIE